ncbi:MAG: hypothetical protein LBQ12_07230 [Deltaproteobacteria bacterium]|jgi:hypothetical protein|nr:hypothetical protein [Deltaproteobacteria bacterium]
MTPFAIAALSALSLALLLSLAMAAPARAEGGWTAYDSSGDIAGPWNIAFTLRYPSFFTRIPLREPAKIPAGADGPDGPDGSGRPARTPAELLVLAAVEPTNGWQVLLSAGLGALDPEDKAVIGSRGFPAFWDGLGRKLSADAGYAFDAAERFSFQGLEAADVHFSAAADKDGGGPSRSFVSQRFVLKGDENITLACRFDFLCRDETRAYTPRDNPVARDWGKPFFDSLRVKG